LLLLFRVSKLIASANVTLIYIIGLINKNNKNEKTSNLIRNDI